MLGEAIAINKSLRSLNLSFNHFTNAPGSNGEPSGFQQLLQGLIENKHLEELRLNDCGLVSSSIDQLSSIVKEHPRLRVLELAHNKFCGESMHAIGAALCKNQALEQLDLRQRHAYVNTANFFEFLAHNGTLRELGVSIGEGTVACLLEHFPGNKALQ